MNGAVVAGVLLIAAVAPVYAGERVFVGEGLVGRLIGDDDHQWTMYGGGAMAARIAVTPEVLCRSNYSVGELAPHLRYTAQPDQSEIAALRDFWLNHGCLQVGAK